MKILISALAATLSALVAIPAAKATDANTCGYVQGPGGWYKSADRSGPYSIDGNCVATLLGSASGGGGAATIADGADVTQGAQADGAYAGSGSATVVAALKGLYAAVKGTVAISGVTASGASATENPLLNGGRAATAEPTAVADGQKVSMMMSKSGKPIVLPYAPVELWNESGGTDGSGSAAAITVMSASGSASLKEYLKSIHCGRDDAGTTAIRITITEGTKTRYLTLPNSGGGGGNNATYDPPIAFAANTAVTATPSASVTGNINCDAQGYNAP